FIAALSPIAKLWREPKCPLSDEWIKKIYIGICKYYSDTKKNEILPFAIIWMELECIMIS
ncbi:LORF2 protein, partial [Crocuta crocuta]